MNIFRRVSGRGLAALIAAVAAFAAIAAGVAVTAFGGGGSTPPPEPLAQALHDAATAPPVAGLTATVSFTNHLLGSSALGSLAGSSSPLLSDTNGRLWVAGDGSFRLELQSDAGDAQIVSDGTTLTVYDYTSNTAYQIALPQQPSTSSTTDTPPTLDQIESALAELAGYASVSGATPDNVGGQPAYTAVLTPKGSGGLVDHAQLSWDAATGAPLELAVYAKGSTSPALALAIDNPSYGPVSHIDYTPPPGAKVVTLTPPTGTGGDNESSSTPVTGLDAVGAAVPFTLVAPDTLDGLARADVRLIGSHDDPGALVTYGDGLGTIVVAEHAASAGGGSSSPLEQLPGVTVGSAQGHELVTSLGTALGFDRNGVSFLVAGSVTQADAEAAAQALAS
jgi:outer membrane lipoprotein-sorting protein